MSNKDNFDRFFEKKQESEKKERSARVKTSEDVKESALGKEVGRLSFENYKSKGIIEGLERENKELAPFRDKVNEGFKCGQCGTKISYDDVKKNLFEANRIRCTECAKKVRAKQQEQKTIIEEYPQLQKRYEALLEESQKEKGLLEEAKSYKEKCSQLTIKYNTLREEHEKALSACKNEALATILEDERRLEVLEGRVRLSSINGIIERVLKTEEEKEEADS